MRPLSSIWMGVDFMRNSDSSDDDFHSLNQALEQTLPTIDALRVLFKDSRKANHMIKESDEALKTKDSNHWEEIQS